MLQALAAAARAAGDSVVQTKAFQGKSDWLVLFGVGAAVNDDARRRQIASGGRVLLWDLGYVDRKKIVGHLRMCIDSDHPQQWLDKTPADASRWEQHGIALREDANPKGPVLLIGLGRKSRLYLNEPDWERQAYARLRKRFPDRTIVFRPKGNDQLRLPCKKDDTSRIEELLRGASLVVCRHSNCAVDALIAGVPFECEDGAARWMHKKPFDAETRLDFLRRLAWWQWRVTEAAQAWSFAKQIVSVANE